MAEDKQYSEQTQAIINRLKAEGQLTRNSENNSLKSVIKRLRGVETEIKQTNTDLYYGLQKVRLEIGKFSDVFQSISENTIRQTEVLRSSVSLEETIDNMFEETRNQLNASIQADRAQREQLETERRQEQVAAVEQAVEEARAPEETPQQEEISEEKADKKTGGLFSILKKFRFTLKNILLVIGGTFVAFNLIKGMIDELTDGGFTRFQNVTIEAFKTFADLLTDPGVMKTLLALATISGPLVVLTKVLPILTAALQAFTTWRIFRSIGALKNMMTPAAAAATGAATVGATSAAAGAGTAAASGLLGAATFSGLKNKIKDMIRPPTGREALSLVKNIASVRGAVALGLGATVLGLGNSLLNYMNSEGAKAAQDIDTLADTPITEFSQSMGAGINTIATATTIGMLLGPKGAIAGAIISGVYVLGKAVYEKVNDYFNDTDEISNATQAALKTMRDRQKAGEDPTKAYEDFKQTAVDEIDRLQTEIALNNQEVERLQMEKAQLRPDGRQAQIVQDDINELMEKNKHLQTQIDTANIAIEKGKETLPVTPESQQEQAQQKFNEILREFANAQAAPTVITNTPTVVNNNSVSNVSTGGSSQVLVAAGGGGNPGSLYGYSGAPGYVS